MSPLFAGRAVRPASLALLPLAACALTFLSCAQRPTEPKPAPVHSLSGRVRLIGHVVRQDGIVIETRVSDDADGVDVILMHGPSVVGHTLTVHGIYTFRNLQNGDYVLSGNVIGAVIDPTRPMIVVNEDVFANDTLLFTSAGDILPVPNPIGASSNIYFALADSESVQVRVLDLSGHEVRRLWNGGLGAGLHSFYWNGTDRTGAQAPQKIFWATIQGPDDARAQILFR